VSSASFAGRGRARKAAIDKRGAGFEYGPVGLDESFGGRMLDSRMEIRVEWGHCDPATIVYNPHFFDWMDRGTHRLFEAAGFHLEQMTRADPEFRSVPLVRVSATFRAPARVGDRLTLSSRVSRFGSRSFDLEHRFLRCSELIAEGAQTRIWGRAAPGAPDKLSAIPLPAEVRAALAAPRVVHLRLCEASD
jgi:4-hydroxybenzoyl-CoA thioesterase